MHVQILVKMVKRAGKSLLQEPANHLVQSIFGSSLPGGCT